jgi:uncharacterized membrane protein (DUF373 family)
MVEISSSGGAFMAQHSSPTDQDQETLLPSTTSPSHKVENRWTAFSVKLLDGGDSLIYAIVGVCFFVGSLFALGYSFWHFYLSIMAVLRPPPRPPANFDPPSLIGQAIIQFISDLLLVLIIMEVLGTVTHYLKERATSLRPFLFIGIISATRGILSIGARLSVEGSKVSYDEFRNAMIELAVNGAVILALGITIKLLGKHVSDHS